MQHSSPLFTSFQCNNLVPLHPTKGMMFCVYVCVYHYEHMNLYELFDMFKLTEVFMVIFNIFGHLGASSRWLLVPFDMTLVVFNSFPTFCYSNI